MTATHIWITQCLCPKRHAIFATYGEADSIETARKAVCDPLREQVARLLANGAINAWCGLCKAPAESWVYEVARTRFRTMEEAASPMRESEREQAIVQEAVAGLPDFLKF